MSEWTRTTPTEAGLYWYFDPTKRLGVQMIELSWRIGHKLVCWQYHSWDIGNSEGWWQGPIERPKPPTKKQRQGA